MNFDHPGQRMYDGGQYGQDYLGREGSDNRMNHFYQDRRNDRSNGFGNYFDHPSAYQYGSDRYGPDRFGMEKQGYDRYGRMFGN